MVELTRPRYGRTVSDAAAPIDDQHPADHKSELWLRYESALVARDGTLAGYASKEELLEFEASHS